DHGPPGLGRAGGAADRDLADGGTVDISAHDAGRRIVGQRQLVPLTVGDVEPLRSDDAALPRAILEQVEDDIALVGGVDVQGRMDAEQAPALARLASLEVEADAHFVAGE